MLEAFLARDISYDGIFVTGVQTTGIFCRPTCAAKKPRPEHLRFFGTAHEALLSGFRPCKRCRPMEPSGTAPEWLRPLLAQIEADPGRRWTDQDVREAGLSPPRVRRWFNAASRHDVPRIWARPAPRCSPGACEGAAHA